MEGYVYLLLSERDRKTYIGSTPDIERRVKEHNDGKCIATKYRRPLKLIYFEKFANLADARKREQYFKTKSDRKELKNIFSRLNTGE